MNKDRVAKVVHKLEQGAEKFIKVAIDPHNHEKAAKVANDLAGKAKAAASQAGHALEELAAKATDKKNQEKAAQVAHDLEIKAKAAAPQLGHVLEDLAEMLTAEHNQKYALTVTKDVVKQVLSTIANLQMSNEECMYFAEEHICPTKNVSDQAHDGAELHTPDYQPVKGEL
jgi:thiamine pyrophosphate-dependent acetolactate synthase large subunit-like protein